MHILYKILRLSVALMLLYPGTSSSQDNETENNKRFFGFHFDFHATRNDKNIGNDIDTAAIELMLRITKPDYVQVDTKGVYGISSYPTDVGFVAGPYQNDILKIWSDLAKKHNVGIYSHYTSLMDEEAAARFPHWARINSDKSRDKKKISIFSNYKDSLFIPQVKEMIYRYGLDGIWVDADSWAFEPEFGSEVLDKIKRETSLDEIPVTEGSDQKKYIEFLRKEYVKYANDYVNKIHSYDPDFKIGINWAYSKMMPEAPQIGVDYLSADMSGKNWIYDASFDSRVFASYNKPWDLMSWSFSDKGIKPEKLLMLEAAEVISMGGGFQSYWFQMRNGGFDKKNLGLMKKISDFCRQRQPFCFETNIIPQVGVFFSRETWASHTKSIYNGGGNDNIQGITSLLLDAGASVEIIMEHQIDKLNSYPLVVIPEADVMGNANKTALLTYVRNGGNLLIMGKDAVTNFSNELGVDMVESFVYKKFALRTGGLDEVFDLPYIQVKAKDGTNVVMNSYTSGNKNLFAPFITTRKYGSGNISGLYSDLGDSYFKNDSKFLRNLFKHLLNDIFPERIVSLDIPGKVHIVASEKDGQLLVHLINLDNFKPWENAEYYSQLDPLRDITLKVKSDQIPYKILQQPENKELEFFYKDGYLNVTVPLIDVYSIIQFVN